MFNKTKIIATVGPSSSEKEVLEQMITAGVNVFRINASHGAHEVHQKAINNIRSINSEKNCHTAILVDLQGPKLRIGDIQNDVFFLEQDAEISFVTYECIGTSERLFMTYKDFPMDVEIGNKILLDDGKIQLEVIHTNRNDEVRAKVVYGGMLSSRKGVNLPNTKISLPCLTPKDLKDLDFALENDVEWIGLSFVRSAKDILELRHIIESKGKKAKIVAKIEKPEAVEAGDEIIAVTDAVMVARGDLGVELPMQQVPFIQKSLVRKCIDSSKPVIIATQMMESMINNATPTRAEVNDVANAVLDGADAVMLSAETSVGRYPVTVIEHMQKIIEAAEEEPSIYNREHPPLFENNRSFISDSICYNACKMAEQAHAKAIVAMTHSGYTAYKISSHRPRAGIFIFTDNEPLLNKLSLVWGVRGFYYNSYISTDETIAEIKAFLREHKYVNEKDIIVNIASIPMTEKGRANMIKLSYC